LKVLTKSDIKPKEIGILKILKPDPGLDSMRKTETKYGKIERTSMMFITPLKNGHFFGAPKNCLNQE
jgi:hypothetical protein